MFLGVFMFLLFVRLFIVNAPRDGLAPRGWGQQLTFFLGSQLINVRTVTCITVLS